MVVGCFAASLLVWWDDRQSEVQIQTINRLKKSAEKAAEDSESRELRAIEARQRIEEAATKERRNLENQIKGLEEKLEPFIEIAIARYPDQNEEKEALSKLALELKTLEARTNRIEAEKEREKVKTSYTKPDSHLRNQVIARLKDLKEDGLKMRINLVCNILWNQSIGGNH